MKPWQEMRRRQETDDKCSLFAIVTDVQLFLQLYIRDHCKKTGHYTYASLPCTHVWNCAVHSRKTVCLAI